MAPPIRLAVLGGSGVATPELIDALKQAPTRPAIHVALIGRSAEKLQAVGAMCARLAARTDPPITVSTHTNAHEGLDGADYVLNQIRVGGYEQRAFDETFPQQFGIPGEETFGPGGMNMALRTIPVALDLARAVEAAAPHALMINLTNPSSIVQYAIQYQTHVRVVSVCDLPITTRQTITTLLGIPHDEAIIRYTGMNHFGWVTSIRWRNQEWMPALLSKLDQYPGLPIDAEVIRALGVFPTAYFRYFYQPNRVLESKQGKPPRGEELQALEAEILAAYQSNAEDDGKPPALVKRSAAWYALMIAPLLLAHANDTGEVQVLQVRNTSILGMALPFMPPASIVEVPCIVRREAILPLAYDGGLPPDLEALLLSNAAFEMLWAEAVVLSDRDRALRAMLMNPLVTNYDQAKGLLDTIWPLHRRSNSHVY